MPGLTIVALPSEDDPVNRISSEKVPHLTLLFLGEQNIGALEIAHVLEFVEHVADTTLFRFGLHVDRRGELGPKNADVLFFTNGWDCKEIKRARGYLLMDDLIRKLYDAQPQFDGWTPHLTLGFPETPAHKIDDPFGRPSYVNFDRLAVWTDNYDGPEFVLKDQFESMMDSGLDVAYSDMIETNDADVLEHYGIKGMKWGVRRDDPGGNRLRTLGRRKPAPSADKAETNASKAKVKKGNTDALSNQELQRLVTRMNLEQQYSNLASKSSTLNTGRNKVNNILNTVDTGKRVYNATPNPVKQKIAKAITTGLITAGTMAGRRAARRG